MGDRLTERQIQKKRPQDLRFDEESTSLSPNKALYLVLMQTETDIYVYSNHLYICGKKKTHTQFCVYTNNIQYSTFAKSTCV